MLYLGNRITPPDLEATQATDGMAGEWSELLRSPRAAARLFAALHAWQAVVASRRLRFQAAERARDGLAVAFFEQELPLHLAVASLNPGATASFELVGYIYVRFPECARQLDAQRRSALFYAIKHRWGTNCLEWIADKLQSVVMETDIEGFSITLHAVQSGCTQEFVVRLAVAVAKVCIAHIDNLVDGRHFQSAKRYCQRSFLVYFSGVPHFPHSLSRLALARSSCDEDTVSILKKAWGDFVDKCGHDDIPLINEDLPSLLRVPIDSIVEVSIVAKGEPLAFQWYYENTPVEGATLPLLYLAQNIRPHNAGIYHCEVVNRKGRTLSTRMELLVVDDTEVPDPTSALRVDKSTLTFEELWCNVKASSGACLQNSNLGVALLLPPNFFCCNDTNGHDVSNSLGADIAIRKRSLREFSPNEVKMQSGDYLVSCVIGVMPQSIGTLLRPATLWISHCLAAGDRFYRPVFVEIDSENSKCTDLENSVCSFEIAKAGVSCSRISKFGQFAVVARKLPGNLELESPLMQLRLVIVRPKNISAAQLTGHIAPYVSLWLVQDRPDMLSHWERTYKPVELDSSFHVDHFTFQVRANQIVTVQIGSATKLVHQWVGAYESGSGIAELASSLPLPVVDILSLLVDACDPFATIALRVSTRKPSHTIGSNNKRDQLCVDNLNKTSTLVSEWQWTLLVPVDFDDFAIKTAVIPKLLSRTASSIELEIEPYSILNGNQEHNQSLTSPYYYVVELATFSSSFWSRYDQTWWFDKTKTKVIEGMYRVVHRGYDRFVSIPTTTFAGCLRVAKCSIDHFGKYSEPVLISPLNELSEPDHSNEDTKRCENLQHSVELEYSKSRMQDIFAASYIHGNIFLNIYGMGMNLDHVCTRLDEMRISIRCANYELALLHLGFSKIREQLTSIRVAKDWFVQELSPVLALERFIPELDRSPVQFASVILEMHHLIQDVFATALKLSSSGWLQHLLKGDWLDNKVAEVQQRVLHGIIAEGCAIQGSLALRESVERQSSLQSEGSPEAQFPWQPPIMQRYLMLVIGRVTDKTLYKYSEQQLTIVQALSETLCCDPDDLAHELRADGFQQALEELKCSNSLSHYLLRVSPKDQDVCSHVPRNIILYFNELITGLTDSGIVHALKVVNLSKDWVTVQGSIEFSHESATLVFTPSIAFEKGCKYRVLVKPHELVTSLGTSLPKTDEGFVFHFSIPS